MSSTSSGHSWRRSVTSPASPHEPLADAELAGKVIQGIQDHRLTQIGVEGVMAVDQPGIPALNGGRLLGFPNERLTHHVVLLDRNVETTVAATPESHLAERLREA
jgi:hypothetical protein